MTFLYAFGGGGGVGGIITVLLSRTAKWPAAAAP